jgi:phosphotriesterase-related protein
MTVTGWLTPGQMGNTLPHEHIIVDFIGARQAAYASPYRYNRDSVFAKALPHLLKLKQFGCKTFVDCTPNYIGRDVLVLRQLSEATGLNIITNTGYYGASGEKYYPDHMDNETAEQLSDRWTKEFHNGIDTTRIRPGFMKLGSDRGPLTDKQKKAVHAAALTHLKTGMTIAIHTGDGAAAKEELEIITSHGVAPDAFIWVHAQNEDDSTMFVDLARQGAWIELDGLHEDSCDRYLRLLRYLKANRLLGKVLLSHDAGWYHVGEPGGGQFNDFNFMFEQFVPRLRQSGFTDGEIDTLVRVNPMNAFTIRIRKQ